jgi:hypothetical protein
MRHQTRQVKSIKPYQKQKMKMFSKSKLPQVKNQKPSQILREFSWAKRKSNCKRWKTLSLLVSSCTTQSSSGFMRQQLMHKLRSKSMSSWKYSIQKSIGLKSQALPPTCSFITSNRPNSCLNWMTKPQLREAKPPVSVDQSSETRIWRV